MEERERGKDRNRGRERERGRNEGNVGGKGR